MAGGFAAIPVAWLDDPRLTGSDIAVVTALTSWVGCEELRPSHAAIAKRAHVSTDTVGRSLNRLRDLGLVQWENRRREDGGKTSNIYRIRLPFVTVDEPDPIPHHAVSIPHHAVGDTAPRGTPSRTMRDEVDKKEVDKKKAARALPASWQPNDKHRAAAAESGVDVAVEAAKFRNHADAQDRKAVRWDSAFNNWLISAAKRVATTRTDAPRRQYRDEPSIDPDTFTPLGVRL